MDPVRFRKKKCEGCEYGRAVSICGDECRTFLCKSCSDRHKSGDETKHHAMVNLSVPRELSRIFPGDEVARLFSSVALSSDSDHADDQGRDSAFLGSDFLEETSHTDSYVDETDLLSSDFIEESNIAAPKSNNTLVSNLHQRDSSVLGSDIEEKTEHTEYASMSDFESTTSPTPKQSGTEPKSVRPSQTVSARSTQSSTFLKETIDEISEDSELTDNNELPWLTKSNTGDVVRSPSLNIKDTKSKTAITRQISTPVSGEDTGAVSRLSGACTLPVNLSDKALFGEDRNDKLTPKLTVTDSQELTVKISQEKKGNDIRSAIILPSGLLVLADNGRKELKLYDQGGKCIISVDDPPCTLGMTYVANDIFATCGVYKKMLLWSVRSMRITRQRKEVELSDSFSGIHFDETLICLVQHQGKYILILDIDGHIKHNILLQNQSRKSFKLGNSVRLDCSSKLVYYSCIEKPKAVRCINFAGEMIWECPLPGIPIGLTNAPQCLLVTDGSNNCVHVLSKSGSCLYKLIDKSLLPSVPEGIYCDITSGKTVINCAVSKDKRYRLLVFFLK